MRQLAADEAGARRGPQWWAEWRRTDPRAAAIRVDIGDRSDGEVEVTGIFW